MSASKCPVCNGRGTVDPGFYSPFERDPNVVRTTTSAGGMRETCRACDGKGLVWPPSDYYPQLPPIPVSVPTFPQWTPPSLEPPYKVWC